MNVSRGTVHGERHFPSPSKEKLGLEFFQKIVIAAIIVSVLIVLGAMSFNFILLWNDKQPAQQEVVAAITTFGGILSGAAAFAYAGLNGIRAYSFNKYVEGDKHD